MTNPDIKTWLPEFKVSAEADYDLLRYFIRTPYLFQITLEGRWLVLGRKGTGKTSIFEFLRQYSAIFNQQTSTVALNFKDYPWPIHKLYKEEMEGELTAYHKSWHFLCVTQALGQLIKTYEQGGAKLNAELSNAKRIMEKLFGSPFPSIVEAVKSKLFRVKELSFPGFELQDFSANLGGLAFEEVAGDKMLQTRLRSNAFVLLEHFERILVNNIDGKEIVLLLDHLDENWLPGQMDEYGRILINLIGVASQINSAPRFRGKLRVVLFLRTDIFDTLQFNDKNKVSQDSAVHIVWTKETLDEMFYERVKAYCPVGVKLNGDGASSVFEVKRVRQGTTPFSHILKRTFYRPRDVIVFFNKVRSVHKKNNSGLYSSANLYAAEQLASEHFYNELMDEWTVQKPILKDMLAALQAIRWETFRYRDFAQKFVKMKPGTSAAELQDYLRFLYSNSIIGHKFGSGWEYYCTRPFLSFDIDKEFKVAAGLKGRLNLAERRSPRKNGNGTATQLKEPNA
jgi:hypothetical protein